jgi:hypothetical protein
MQQKYFKIINYDYNYDVVTVWCQIKKNNFNFVTIYAHKIKNKFKNKIVTVNADKIKINKNCYHICSQLNFL